MKTLTLTMTTGPMSGKVYSLDGNRVERLLDGMMKYESDVPFMSERVRELAGVFRSQHGIIDTIIREGRERAAWDTMMCLTGQMQVAEKMVFGEQGPGLTSSG